MIQIWFTGARLILFSNVKNMFSMPNLQEHSGRKRMMSNTYSKSYLQNSPAMAAISKTLIYDRFLPELKSQAESSASFDMFSLSNGATMDFVTGYLFGLASSSNFIQDKAARCNFLEKYDSRRTYTFWAQETPGFHAFLSRLGIVLTPKFVYEANSEIQKWTLNMCENARLFLARTKADSAEKLSAEDVGNFPTVYSQLSSAMVKSALKNGTALDIEKQRFDVASEVLDQLAAGFETSGITVTYLIHELSQRPDLQAALRKELLQLDPPISFTDSDEANPELPSAKSVDALPILNAILTETLRLRAAIPGPEPRMTPPGGCTLGPEGEYTGIPGGMRISAQPHSLHRNPEVFEKPEEWRPERYLESSEEKLKEMKRWFWAFGSGGRMCVGSNLALQEIKFIVAALYTNFTTHIVDDEGIEQMDVYTAPPKGGKLIVRVESVVD
jgi:cytochrome P450